MSQLVVRKSSDQDLSAGSLTLDVVIGTDTPNVEGDFELLFVGLSAGSAISQAVAVRLISAEGSAYDFDIDTDTLSSATNYVFRPSPGIPLKRGDTVRFTCANSGTPSITVSAEIRLKGIS